MKNHGTLCIFCCICKVAAGSENPEMPEEKNSVPKGTEFF